MYLLYLGCWCFLPSFLSWECLEPVAARNLGDRVCPHTHIGSEHRIHIVDSPIRVQWGSGPMCFFPPFLSPFISCGQRLQPTIVLVVPSTAFSKHGLM